MRSCKRARGGILTSKVFATLMAIVLCVGFIPYVPAAAYADTGLVGGDPVFNLAAEGTVTGGDTISESGTYNLADDATGGITIGENLEVTIVGKGAEKRFEGLNIKVGNGTTLTIQNLYANQGTGENAGSTIDFQGNGTLKIEGQNLIDNDGGLNAAVVHVGAGNEVHFTGTGTLYGYKSALCSYIGANSNEANGKIVFDGGYWFLKGTKTGAVIGGDSTTDKGGDIVINGGELYVKGVAKGALIGGSNQGISGDVYINGGLVELFEDFSGPAIGAGNAANAGNVYVTGGSLKTTLSSNSANQYGQSATFGGMPGVSWAAVKALNADNYALLAFDASAYINDLANDTVTVSVDGSPFYSGRAYTYVTNEVKNPSDITGTTTDNWLPNDSTWLLTAENYGTSAYPNKSGSSLVPEKNLYFALPKADHMLKVNGDKYTATWDADAGAFVVAAVPNPADTYDWDSTTWAGGLDFSWYDESDVKTSYHLTTPAQWEALAWICSEHLGQLADYEENTNGNVVAIKGTVPSAQNTFEGVQFYLDNNIDMGGVQTDGSWSGPNYYPIGSQGWNDKQNACWYGSFYGSMDGQGHYVTNVYANRGSGQSYQSVGLFGRVGAIDDASSYPAANIVIENLGVSGYISGGRSVGGIVGKTLHVASGYQVSIKNCVNRATVTSTDKKGLGGICGAFWNNPYMENCYDLGIVTGGGRPKGSIVGGNEGTIVNAYSTQTDLPIMGENATSTATVTNSYRMGTDKTEAEMKDKAFVLDLNGGGSAFNVDTDNLNGGLPCLAWEGGTPYAADDAQTIDDAVNAIAAIGSDVTVDSKDAIEAAQAAYNALTDDQKALLPAETQAAYDTALATYTSALVGAIPSDATTATGIAAVEEALDAYNSLTAEQKALVPAATASALISAQQTVANAQLDAANNAIAEANNNAQTSEQGRLAALATAAATQKLLNTANAQVNQLKKDVASAQTQAASSLKANTMTVKAKTVKASSTKKTTIKKAKAFTVKGAQGKVTFYKVSGNAKITVTKAGKVKVSKGLKKNKTYKVKVLVCAAGNKSYAPATKTVTLKVKIK